MRQVHKAGEKCFVDYSGKKLAIVDPSTGERVEVELFVAVMGASNFTYAEVTATQQSADWIASHVRLVSYLGGVPRAFVPDQLKSGSRTPGLNGVMPTRGLLLSDRWDAVWPTYAATHRKELRCAARSGSHPR